MMRYATSALLLALAAPASAQVAIDASGVRSGGVRIDASGVHSGDASVTARGVQTARAGTTTINDNQGDRKVNCRGGSLTVNGNHNRIDALECGAITLAGNDNQLRWHRERGRSAVSNVGHHNAVVRF